MSEPRVTLSLLGSFQARLGTGPPARLATKKSQALLAYLAAGRQPKARATVAALLWGGAEEEQSRKSLRQAIFTLRKALIAAAPGWLRVEGETISLDPEAVDVDAWNFERLLREGTPEATERAVALYRGPFLEGFSLREAPFDEWVTGERARVRELMLSGLSSLLGHYTRTGATARAIETGKQILELDPAQESVHRALMRLYDSQGESNLAMRQYRHCVDVLRRELGVRPEAASRALYDEIRRRQRAIARAQTAAAAPPPAETPSPPEDARPPKRPPSTERPRSAVKPKPRR